MFFFLAGFRLGGLGTATTLTLGAAAAQMAKPSLLGQVSQPAAAAGAVTTTTTAASVFRLGKFEEANYMIMAYHISHHRS